MVLLVEVSTTMVANGSSISGNYNRRQKWLQNLVYPEWPKVYESNWGSSYGAPHFVFPTNVAASITPKITFRVATPSYDYKLPDHVNTALSRYVESMDFSELTETFNKITDDFSEKITSVFRDLPGFRGVTPVLSPAAESSTLSAARVKNWTRIGAQAVTEHAGGTQHSETPAGLDDLEPKDLQMTAKMLYAEIKHLRENRDSWGTSNDDFSDLEAIYEPVAHSGDSPNRGNGAAAPWTRADKLALAALVLTLLGMLNDLQGPVTQQPQITNDPPSIEAPSVKAAPGESAESSEAFSYGPEIEDGESEKLR